MEKKDESISSVLDFVMKNTGMDEETLLCDTHEYKFPALEKAAELIMKWAREERIFHIFADYDVDGITSGESMKMLLRALRVPKEHIIVRYPKRFSEGYGMSEKAVKEFDSSGVIITVDNGIAAFDAVKEAKAKGMPVLVTDHHLAAVNELGQKMLPDADYCVDPNAINDQAEFTDYCGCGIVLKLAEYMLKPDKNVKTLVRIKSNAAIATIADCVPLIGENRCIVKEGLNLLSNHKEFQTSGMNALLSECNLKWKVSETDISFRIAPCLNATGRLNDDGAAIAARLISFDGDEFTAADLARNQIAFNEERKSLQKIWVWKAEAMVKDDEKSIILYPEGCPEGLAGIIAGQLAERHNRPAIVFTDNGDGILKGSGRSVEGVNLKNTLDKCQDFLVTYGGHAMAAGLRVRDIEGFKKAFNEALEIPETKTEKTYDLLIDGSDVTTIIDEIDALAPYGEGNPTPTFFVQNVELIPKGSAHYSELKNGGVKLFADGYSATTFSCTDKYLENISRKVNLLGTISRNYFGGNSYIDVHFDDVESVANKFVRKTSLQALLDDAAMKFSK